ncbi:MAG: ABC transporter ATP-binding protein [Deltaproteobacteria bacterium]|nr:ABC transporter ATP-binding protein [Deltaproteobacteria bacterium]MBW2339219.1 ABC transporter ATP-binding protein [Deltaproteobacteria bacterium]
MIILKNLTKIYRGIKAVDNLNLQIPQGTIFGFIGPNGAGKTTTIKMMTGVLRPTKGSISIDGLDIAKEPSQAKRIIGFIPDRPFLYEKLSGIEFLRFKAGLYGMAGAGLDEDISDLLNLFELSDWADELIESYSHGMRQRLIIASALIHKPRVIIVDEPMVALDPRGAKLVKELFKERATKGTTVFMSTHTLALAQEVCQQIAIVDKGQIVASGTSKDLEEQAGVMGDLERIFLTITGGPTET